jgi:hypothetical protein
VNAGPNAARCGKGYGSGCVPFAQLHDLDLNYSRE